MSPAKSVHTVGPPAPEPYPALSYELFPPRSTSAAETLWRTIRELEQTSPDYVSVTYGAS
ncbi:methylenetetrahydrofolate reductase, partial [Arthrobacter sp.]